MLQNHLIVFERQCRDYLPGGEFGGLTADQEAVRNCPLTNRECESIMATLDQSLEVTPNTTPGYMEAGVLLNTASLPDHFASSSEEEEQQQFDVARKYATETISDNKKEFGAVCFCSESFAEPGGKEK